MKCSVVSCLIVASVILYGSYPVAEGASPRGFPAFRSCGEYVAGGLVSCPTSEDGNALGPCRFKIGTGTPIEIPLELNRQEWDELSDLDGVRVKLVFKLTSLKPPLQALRVPGSDYEVITEYRERDDLEQRKKASCKP